MGNENRSPTCNLTNISSELIASDPSSYEFYQFAELLFKQLDKNPDASDWEGDGQLWFTSNPSLSFAKSDISDFKVNEDDSLQIEATFLGLSGAHSPLPGFLLEQVAQEDETGLRRVFLDFFNHRLISFAYRAWRKYRYYASFQPEAKDIFSNRFFALVGLGDPELRTGTALNWCKMLAYAGVLASRSRSPQMVSGIVAHYFDLDEVEIGEWEMRIVDIPEHQRMKLGSVNCGLGQTSIIGSRVRDCTGKFVVHIKNLTRARFYDFLPKGKEYKTFCKLIEFVLREQMAFDLELELKPHEAPNVTLNNKDSGLLGWSSFMGDTNDKRCFARIQVRA